MHEESEEHHDHTRPTYYSVILLIQIKFNIHTPLRELHVSREEDHPILQLNLQNGDGKGLTTKTNDQVVLDY